MVGLAHGGRVYLAADRAITDEAGNIALLACRKIARFKGYAIGFAGGLTVAAALRNFDPISAPDSDVHVWVEQVLLRRLAQPALDDDTELLIAVRGRLFHTVGRHSAAEYQDGIAAIGSGGPTAQAVVAALRQRTKLKPRTIVSDAIKYASLFRWDVGGTPDTVVI